MFLESMHSAPLLSLVLVSVFVLLCSELNNWQILEWQLDQLAMRPGSEGDAAEQQYIAVRVTACLKGGDKWYKSRKCVFQTPRFNHLLSFLFQVFFPSGS